jgi:glycosyltransferase involved in cell wall biosynthesis
MKVLVFTTLYPNNVWPTGGVFIKERMIHFARLDDCTVKVVAPVPYFPRLKINWRWQFSQVAKKEIRDDIEVYHPRFLMVPKVGMVFYGLMMFFSVVMLVKKLRRTFEFDLIDAHWVYPDGLAAVLLGRVFKIPVVVSARGSDINLYAQWPIMRWLIRFTLQKADHVIAVSEALKRRMVALGISQQAISVVPNGVDRQKFRPALKSEARKSLGIPAEAQVILSVGHLTPNKGVLLLIKSLKLVLEAEPTKNILLVVVGSGEYRSQLEKAVSALGLQAHVRFMGSVAHEQLYLSYSAADVSCLLSEMEGWPNVVLESIACGTPVIATPVGGIPEIIRSDEVGLLAERDEISVANAIRHALRKSWSGSRLVQCAKQHGWNETAVILRNLFCSLLSERRQFSGERIVPS